MSSEMRKQKSRRKSQRTLKGFYVVGKDTLKVFEEAPREETSNWDGSDECLRGTLKESVVYLVHL